MPQTSSSLAWITIARANQGPSGNWANPNLKATKHNMIGRCIDSTLEMKVIPQSDPQTPPPPIPLTSRNHQPIRCHFTVTLHTEGLMLGTSVPLGWSPHPLQESTGGDTVLTPLPAIYKCKDISQEVTFTCKCSQTQLAAKGGAPAVGEGGVQKHVPAIHVGHQAAKPFIRYSTTLTSIGMSRSDQASGGSSMEGHASYCQQRGGVLI